MTYSLKTISVRLGDAHGVFCGLCDLLNEVVHLGVRLDGRPALLDVVETLVGVAVDRVQRAIETLGDGRRGIEERAGDGRGLVVGQLRERVLLHEAVRRLQ